MYPRIVRDSWDLTWVVKADEFTESQDLHEIYSDRRFFVSSLRYPRFYSSKRSWVPVIRFARDIIFRDPSVNEGEQARR